MYENNEGDIYICNMLPFPLDVFHYILTLKERIAVKSY